jgi:hypothetical protein
MKLSTILLTILFSITSWASDLSKSSVFFYQPEEGKLALRGGVDIGYDSLDQKRKTTGSIVTRQVVSYSLEVETQYSFSDLFSLSFTPTFGIRVNDFITWQSPVTYTEEGFKDLDFSAKGRMGLTDNIEMIYGGTYLWSPSDLTIKNKFDYNYFSGGDSLSGYIGALYKVDAMKFSLYYERDLWAEDKSVDDQENNLKYTYSVDESQTIGITAETLATQVVKVGAALRFFKDTDLAGYSQIDYWELEGIIKLNSDDNTEVFTSMSYGKISNDEVDLFTISNSHVFNLSLNARYTF